MFMGIGGDLGKGQFREFSFWGLGSWRLNWREAPSKTIERMDFTAVGAQRENKGSSPSNWLMAKGMTLYLNII
jgi:hypothetical protein